MVENSETSSQSKPIEILEAFKPLLTRLHTYYVYSSGRGCGKSYGIAQCVILLAAISKKRILCIREIQKSLNESVKALVENLIVDMGLGNIFSIKHDSIECVNGSKFLFMGMRDANAINVKSIADIDITWVEEAEAFSKKSWELLIPSVTRTSNPQIIISFNPRYEDDVIYQTFFVRKPPPRSFIKKLYPEDNPFFAQSNLEVQRLHDLETLPESEYRHKWLGELISLSEECIFTKEGFAKMVDGKNMPTTLDDFKRSNYSEVYIALDPATTSAETSNEFGVVVVGITKDGIYHVIGDYTDHHTPSDVAVLTSSLYNQFDCSGCVVETNQGGDFIKHVLLEFNPGLYIIEVKATKDKTYRASPVASLASLGKLKVLDIFTPRDRLLLQMRNTTKRGYLGPKGSSPDALDACAWGIHHLSGLSERFTANSLFNVEDLAFDSNFTFAQDIQAIVGYDAVENLCVLTYRLVQNRDTQTKIEILDCINYIHPNIQEIIERLVGNITTLYLPELYVFESFTNPQISTYEPSTDKYDGVLLQGLDFVKRGLFQFSGKPHGFSVYKSSRGEVLKLELSKAKLDEKFESIVIKTFCELGRLYF